MPIPIIHQKTFRIPKFFCKFSPKNISYSNVFLQIFAFHFSPLCYSPKHFLSWRRTRPVTIEKWNKKNPILSYCIPKRFLVALVAGGGRIWNSTRQFFSIHYCFPFCGTCRIRNSILSLYPTNCPWRPRL